MKNLTIQNIIKSTAYLSLIIFAFINPYLMDGFVQTMIIYAEQIITA